MESWSAARGKSCGSGGVLDWSAGFSSTPILHDSITPFHLSVKPFLDLAVRVERHALAAIRPAHVADADKIGCGQAIEHADFGAQQGGLAAKTHWSNTELIRRLDDVALQLVALGVWVAIIESAQELLLRILIAGGSVAADADAENAWPAALALGLQHRIENRLAAAIEVAASL